MPDAGIVRISPSACRKSPLPIRSSTLGNIRNCRSSWFSHRTGKTSGRPANKRRNNSIFSADEELLVTVALAKAVWRSDISFCSSASSSRSNANRSASRAANRRRMRAISSEVSPSPTKVSACFSPFRSRQTIGQSRRGLKTGNARPAAVPWDYAERKPPRTGRKPRLQANDSA